MAKNQNTNNDEDIIVTLTMEDDSEVDCRILTIFEVEELKQEYIVLLPLDDQGNENSEGTIYIYRYFEKADGEPSIEPIKSDEEYEIVDDVFDQLLDDIEFDEM